jgi:hypothetical protein
VSNTDAGTLTDYAYCDTGARTIVTSSVHVQLPIRQQRSATAFCPAGTVPISGGYRFKNGADGTGAAFRSRKVGGGWQVAGYNGGPGKSEFTTFAYCERNGHQLQARSSTVSIPNATKDSAKTACPAGTRIVSGGFDGHLTTSYGLRVAVPIASSRIQNAWRAIAVAQSGGPDAKLTAFAYCEPV